MRNGFGVLILAFSLTGCAIAERSDKFGADLDIGIGGLIGYVADVRLKASIGFSKTCLCEEARHAIKMPHARPTDPPYL